MNDIFDNQNLKVNDFQTRCVLKNNFGRDEIIDVYAYSDTLIEVCLDDKILISFANKDNLILFINALTTALGLV